MKLLHIVGDSRWGGGGVVISQLAEMSQRLGWDVDVLTTDPAFQDVLRERKVGVVDLDVIWREIRPWRDVKGLYHLWKFLRASSYDLVHTHTSKAGFVGRLAAKLAGVPAIVHTAHGFAFHEESDPMTLRTCSLLERMAAYCCHRIITVSEFHRRWAIQLGISDETKTTAIPNGIPEESMEWSVDALRVNLGIEPGELAIFTIGRLARQKGLEYLIEALPRLADQFARPFKVFLAGDGPLMTELQRLVTDRGLEDKVVFLGFRKDVRQLLLACDLVVLPTLREGLSIALIEAMAAGKAIITTTIGSNKEATLNGEAALLIPPKSPAAIADAITQIVENAWMAARLATRAREIYLASYTDTHMLKAYRGIYEEVLSSRSFAVTADSQFEAQA